MARRRRLYSEGDWFVVEIPSYGTVVGLIARASPDGVLGGYFFGPVCAPLDHSVLRDLRKADAIFVCHFGDPGIVDGRWRLIGRQGEWDRAEWALPEFAYLDPVDPNLAFGRVYDDSNPNSLPAERRIPIAEARSMPRDGMYGHIAVEKTLERILHGELPRGQDAGGN